MQREHSRRGFTISHQKVVVELDFSGALWGYTDITLIPSTANLKTIHLHSKQCSIHSVTVASHQADFVHNDPFAHLSISNPQDCHTYPELKRKLYSAIAEGDEGELSIAVPKEVSLRPSGHVNQNGLASEVATPEPQTPGPSFQTPLAEFMPITVHIEYSLRNPSDGLQFVLPTDSYPYRIPHAFTTPSSPDAARCWVPCIDSFWEKCTWEFEFVVPRYLEEPEIRRNEEGELEVVDERNPTVVVCSGDLVEQVAHPNNSNKTIFLFSQTTLTSVQHIAFAAGPFHVYPIPLDTALEDAAPGSSQPSMHAFCLPGHENMLRSSVSCLRAAMNFYSTDFGSYPFGCYKVVAVDELPTQRFDSATLSLISVDLLHGDDAIEQVLETRQVLGHALACQWMGINIHQKTWSDTWLVNGLALYITGLYIRKILGNNEYRFRLKRDMQRVVDWDNGSMPPICQPQHHDPPDAAVLPFVNLKSPLILHILDRRLGKSGTSLGLSRVLPKIFLSAMTGEMPNNALSTHSFLRTCRKVSGVDLRTFAEQWIYGSGCPAFGFTATFNRKKMAVEITMRQECPAYRALEQNEVSKLLNKPVPFFEGQMTVRIHEADGTPYEHVLDIRSAFKRYEVPFNTKYKRIRRNTKRYLARQAAAQAAAEGDPEAVEAMGLIDMGFGLDIWEKEKERENWKVADWTEEEEQVMSGATYEWIRMDADFEWIAAVAFEQPDFMWVSQLQRDRDVVAQMEAVHALARQPTAIVSSTFTKTVLVSNYYYRIRCEAAACLVNCAIRKLDFLGLFHMFKLFLRYCYDPEDPNQDLFSHNYVPKPNDFSDLAEYFVRKSLVDGIAQVRFENGKTPSVVRQFLVDQLRYNDNTANPYSDAFYICTLMAASACANVPTAPPERGELLKEEVRSEQTAEDASLLNQALEEVNRYRSMDRLIPSPHNVVTTAVLEFYLLLSVANLVPNDMKVFFPLTREGNYTQVRIAAFDGLFMTKWYSPPIMRYVLAVMANDPSRAVRRHVARAACQSLALLVSMGEMKNAIKESESLLIEEDGSMPEKAREAKKSEVEITIKVLRKDREIGKNEALREFLMPVALAPDVDYEVRWAIIKLADLVLRGVEEAPPKVTIHLPPTPATETAPQLPLVRPTVKAKVPGKPSALVRTPTLPTPISATPKLKIIPSGSHAPAISTPGGSAGHAKQNAKPPTAAPERPKLKTKQLNGVTKPSHIPKAQSGGMVINDLRACRNALKKLNVHKNCPIFMQPVDPVRDHAPNYYNVIKNPMDLSTMNAKVENGKYKDRFAFESDFRLMISNAKRYNPAGTYAHTEALGLEAFFEKLWTRINKTLEAASKANEPEALDHLPSITVKRPVARPTISTAPIPPAPQPSTTPAPLQSRPTIKLKVGGSSQKPAEEPTAPLKIKPKKPKPPVEIDGPPPPYVDDGSHDLLQEVIAIEREKDEKRSRHHVEPPKPPTPAPTPTPKASGSGPPPTKRRKPSPQEDGPSAVTPPPKKERPAPPPAPTPAPAARPAEKPIAPAPKAAPTAPKPKKEKPPAPEVAPTPPTPANAPRPSIKGKEKEVSASNASTPGKPKKLSMPGPFNEKKCRDTLKALLKLPESLIFAQPVDPVRDGCPTYYEEIEHPMDFGTMSTKLSKGQYSTMEEFAKDAGLVFDNCRQFNPPTTYPVNCADLVEKVFRKEWSKAVEKKMSWAEKRSLQGLMTQVVKEDISWVFREPVDPVLLGIPTYFEVIPRKDARDLRTIRHKLDADKYDSIEAFEADIDLMIRNAITFNGVDSEVGKLAGALEDRIKDLLSNMRSGGGTKKRKDGLENGTSQPTKKVKLV
ncbi:TATA-binding protein associated factor Taf2 [Coniophora puteana RWD-64-598 SS2]|uniref:Transcription initiation factor TFIID subunit 2 n=1 Tax=Coniophora puteana (strain RWD-64-598) TaxID=741705 RepID=A0A5M3N8E6_CONPW|nr:TATA-binding protein associated factor Taf2 [Coniophora puteana RWD-64-598 SS2]EIW87115.1 TATA-binding protein associated factor Taf2 [Coniophora puteana RWD-64-598 SS2]